MPWPLVVHLRTALAAAALVAASLLSGTLQAQDLGASDRVLIGKGSLFTNDVLGDMRDRWRSGSFVLSRVTGPAGGAANFDSGLPGFGQIREFRFRTEILQPANLTAPAPNDRRYAGVMSLGYHTHFGLGPAEASLGADLVGIGPATLVGDLQRAFHGIVGLSDPTPALANQLPNALHPTLLAEVGLPVPITQSLRLRPFVEGQAGVETFVRGGIDVMFGQIGPGAVMLRDSSTGHRYRAGPAPREHLLGFVVGGDIAHVASSAYLPAGGAARLKTVRSRVRAGLHWSSESADVFYGVTYLGPEFTQQVTGQTVGSIHLRLRF